jgi:hypothetical protein
VKGGYRHNGASPATLERPIMRQNGASERSYGAAGRELVRGEQRREAGVVAFARIGPARVAQRVALRLVQNRGDEVKKS